MVRDRVWGTCLRKTYTQRHAEREICYTTLILLFHATTKNNIYKQLLRNKAYNSQKKKANKKNYKSNKLNNIDLTKNYFN